DLKTEKEIYERLQEHPRIAAYRGCTTDGIILDYYRNGTMRNWIQQNSSSLTPIDKQRWLMQICDALNYIHGKNVLHSDISTNNILLCDHETARWGNFKRCWPWISEKKHVDIRLCDFAGSSLDGRKASVTYETRCSRPGKVEIPIVQDEMFAFASVVYEIYTGKRPFELVESDEEIEEKFERGEFPNTASIRPEWVGQMIECLWKNDNVFADFSAIKLFIEGI
ncbi:kinase-like domain-containing protein, partial [Peziza echinospora]